MKKCDKGHGWKIWTLRLILVILIVWWMSIIFGFSSENGEQSQSLSDRITIQVVHIIEPDFDKMDSISQEEFFGKVSFAVRKVGHFGEYGILGILTGCFLITFEKIRKSKAIKVIIIATTFCMLYAVTDEFHQGFVAGRSPKIMDVIIDTLGGMTGATMVSVLLFLKTRKDKAKFI